MFVCVFLQKHYKHRGFGQFWPLFFGGFLGAEVGPITGPHVGPFF